MPRSKWDPTSTAITSCQLTSPNPNPNPSQVTPIGWISSPYKERFGTPRQPTVDEQVSGGKLQEGEIVLAPDVSTLALRGLAGFEYCCTPHGARTPNEQADT